MAEMGIRARMFVKDIMTSPVITIDEDASVNEAAQLMDTNKVGCIIVTSKKGKPLGIITERDLVTRVLAKNAIPSKLAVREVMTSPLITVDPDETLSETARRMSRLNIRRLGVIYKGNLLGLVSSKDILAITPELIEIIQEKARIEGGTEVKEAAWHPPLAGYCDQCGQWSDDLQEVEGDFLCENCRTELRAEY
ncbi:MAG: CBS domain-containing protein [Candidatus Bathyarchaeota archaeon]|nr:CBS domain-containing protein [Candidatus Bathyarchaeota archaeon]MDH5531946.1 CBS domain-containing protein [Candidatus Bathyarchaeota archaeon]MDH5712655.1 CBS domain-containing protein [Candidatus Bathyarchaeota archaeon]